MRLGSVCLLHFQNLRRRSRLGLDARLGGRAGLLAACFLWRAGGFSLLGLVVGAVHPYYYYTSYSILFMLSLWLANLVTLVGDAWMVD